MPSYSKSVFYATPILPPKFDDKFMQRALKEYMYDTAEEIEKDIRRPIKHWKHRVEITAHVQAYYVPLSLELVIEVHDDPYFYVEGGTKKHFVAPRTKKALHWVQGGEGYFSKGHWVKGIKKRNWLFYVKRKWDKKLADTFQMLINDYATRAGY